MKWVARVLVAISGMLILLLVVGLLTPASHTARTRAHFAAAPDSVWAVISAVEQWPDWSRAIHTVERLPDREGFERWTTEAEFGNAVLEIQIRQPPSRLQTFIDAGIFSGSWTYEVGAAGDGTQLTITETGQSGNPWLRGLMILSDKYASMIAFHEDLAVRFGESVAPERLP